jgi:hypothetical protein
VRERGVATAPSTVKRQSSGIEGMPFEFSTKNSSTGVIGGGARA